MTFSILPQWGNDKIQARGLNLANTYLMQCRPYNFYLQILADVPRASGQVHVILALIMNSVTTSLCPKMCFKNDRPFRILTVFHAPGFQKASQQDKPLFSHIFVFSVLLI